MVCYTLRFRLFLCASVVRCDRTPILALFALRRGQLWLVMQGLEGHRPVTLSFRTCDLRRKLILLLSFPSPA